MNRRCRPMIFLKSLYQNNRFLANGWPSIIRLLQSYEVLLIHCCEPNCSIPLPLSTIAIVQLSFCKDLVQNEKDIHWRYFFGKLYNVQCVHEVFIEWQSKVSIFLKIIVLIEEPISKKVSRKMANFLKSWMIDLFEVHCFSCTLKVWQSRPQVNVFSKGLN